MQMTTMQDPTILPTSLLYVPAIKSHFFAKALASAAGALILDLEDSVMPGDKAQARENLRVFLEENTAPGKEIWVRVNAPSQIEQARKDLAALRSGTVAGIVVPKIEREAFAQLARELDADSRLRTISVIGLIESAVGILDVAALARQPHVVSLGLGRVDLFADLRMEVSDETDTAFDALALQVVIACSAAGIAAPIAPVALTMDDPNSAERSRHYLRRGFRSQTAIHPSQCASINAVYTPTEDQYRAAQELVDAFAGSEGTLVAPDGRFVDEAVVRHAREICERYRILTASGSQNTVKEK